MDSLDSDFICKSYGSSGFTVGTCPEMVRSLRPPESPAKGPGISGPLFLFCLSAKVWCLSGLGPEIPRRWGGISGPPESPAQMTGISGPSFFSASCFCVVPLWCWSGASPEGDRSLRPGRSLRPSTSLPRPESPVTWAGVSGLKRPQRLVFWGGAIKSPLLPQNLAAHSF